MECCYTVVTENVVNLSYTSHILDQGYKLCQQQHPEVKGEIAIMFHFNNNYYGTKL